MHQVPRSAGPRAGPPRRSAPRQGRRCGDVRDVERASPRSTATTPAPGRPSCATRRRRRSRRSPQAHADEIDFDELAAVAARRAARARAVQGRGPRAWRSGTMHDLAVGVHPGGADVWRLAVVVRVRHRGRRAAGPLQPARPELEPAAVASGPARGARPTQPLRDLIAAVLRHAGGVRVDHVIGLFRLWWVPEGRPTVRGHLRPLRPRGDDRRARPRGRTGPAPSSSARTSASSSRPRATTSRSRGILGTSILWFERDGDGRPLPAERWRELVPRLGHHARPATDRRLPRRRARAAARAPRSADPTARGGARRGRRGARVVARRGAVARAARPTTQASSRRRDGPAPLPHADARRGCCAWRCTDAVGDRRTQNQPGTTRRVPELAGAALRARRQAVLLEDVMAPSRRPTWCAGCACSRHTYDRQPCPSRHAPSSAPTTRTSTPTSCSPPSLYPRPIAWVTTLSDGRHRQPGAALLLHRRVREPAHRAVHLGGQQGHAAQRQPPPASSSSASPTGR